MLGAIWIPSDLISGGEGTDGRVPVGLIGAVQAKLLGSGQRAKKLRTSSQQKPRLKAEPESLSTLTAPSARTGNLRTCEARHAQVVLQLEVRAPARIDAVEVFFTEAKHQRGLQLVVRQLV